MEEAVRLNADAAEPASAKAREASLPRCEHVLELLLTHRGNPSAEIDRVLADDPLGRQVERVGGETWGKGQSDSSCPGVPGIVGTPGDAGLRIGNIGHWRLIV